MYKLLIYDIIVNTIFPERKSAIYTEFVIAISVCLHCANFCSYCSKAPKLHSFQISIYFLNASLKRSFGIPKCFWQNVP